MAESDIRDADSYEELKNYSPEELRQERRRVENELAQVERTLDRVKHTLKLRKQETNSLTAVYSGPEWETPRSQGFRTAKEAIDDTKRARQNELQERKRLIDRVLGAWQSGRIELTSETEPDSSKASEMERTIVIGKWLLQHREEHDQLPDFQGSKGVFKEEAAEVIGDEGESMSKSTVYNALSGTGCWDEDPKQGDSSGLKEILRRTMDYAEQHSHASQRSQNDD